MTLALIKVIGAIWALIPFLWGGAPEQKFLEQVRPDFFSLKKFPTVTYIKIIGAIWALIPFQWGGAPEQKCLEPVRLKNFSRKIIQDPNPYTNYRGHMGSYTFPMGRGT